MAFFDIIKIWEIGWDSMRFIGQVKQEEESEIGGTNSEQIWFKQSHT